MGIVDHLPDIQPRLGDLDDAILFRVRSDLAGRGSQDRWVRDVERLLADHLAVNRAGDGCNGRIVFHLFLERLLLRSHSDPHQRNDRSGGYHQFHAVRGLGMGEDGRGRHAGDVTGHRIHGSGAQMAGQRDDRWKRQGLTSREVT